jgi:hypothetical protein
MILKILVATDLILVLLFLLFMVVASLSPKMRAEQADFSLKGRKDYRLARQLLTAFLPWVMIGTLIRVAGIAQAKHPRFVVPLYIADVLISILVLCCLLWSIYCIYYNANLRMKHATGPS